MSATFLTVFIGITIGALAGFYRSWVEEVLMRITEFFQVLPTLLFSMVIVALLGATLPMITLAIGLVYWPAVARITRSEFLRIREFEYVMAARACGVSNGKLIFRVILPNALPPIIVQAALMVGSAILFEAGLSFLDLTDLNIVSWEQISAPTANIPLMPAIRSPFRAWPFSSRFWPSRWSVMASTTYSIQS